MGFFMHRTISAIVGSFNRVCRELKLKDKWYSNMYYVKPRVQRRTAERQSREAAFKGKFRVRLNIMSRMQEFYK